MIMANYKDISYSIEKIIQSDLKARSLYLDLIHKSRTRELEKLETLHPFITYIVGKIKKLHGDDLDPKELKKAIIHFYSKNFIGIDIDL